jgi:hypothetical protein
MDYQASFAFGERHLINVNAILLDKDDPDMMRRVDPFIRTLVADAKAHGYGEYRTHLDYMDLVASTYDFNGGALGKLNAKVKAALDPFGIIAPGKSGIGTAAGQSGIADEQASPLLRAAASSPCSPCCPPRLRSRRAKGSGSGCRSRSAPGPALAATTADAFRPAKRERR